MKRFKTITALTLIFVGFANVTHAQIKYAGTFNYSNQGNTYASKHTKKALADISSEVSSTLDMKELGLKSTVSSSYLLSQQFVYDNLKSLKQTYSIPDIYYDVDQPSIRQDAMQTLDKLVHLLSEEPGLAVAITSYCDSRMSTYNQKLAKERALAAIYYLVTKGVDPDRLMIEKYGRSRVTNPCNSDSACTFTQQQLNRKTEFNIIINGENLARLHSYYD